MDSQNAHVESVEHEERAAAELSASVRNTLLTQVRAMETPWSKLSERKQQTIIDAVDRCAEETVRRAVGIIAKRGFDAMHVRVKDFTVKEGVIKGKFEATMTADNVVMLGDHQGAVAILVVADPEAFMLGAPAKPDPDQPELPTDGGEDEDEDEETDQEPADDDGDGSAAGRADTAPAQPAASSLRPYCQKPGQETCGGYGAKHCPACEKLAQAAKQEAA